LNRFANEIKEDKKYLKIYLYNSTWFSAYLVSEIMFET
jgi:hypothetical protein